MKPVKNIHLFENYEKCLIVFENASFMEVNIN